MADGIDHMTRIWDDLTRPLRRRYCVTVMDNWTPMRLFWTLEGAKHFYKEHRSCAHLFKWERGAWRSMLDPFPHQ